MEDINHMCNIKSTQGLKFDIEYSSHMEYNCTR